MELRNKCIIYSLVGFIAGMFVGMAFWMTMSPLQDRSFIVHILVSGLHGLIPCGATIVFQIESWGLTKATTVHALITLATCIAIDIPMKWYHPGLEMVIVFIIYVFLYTIIWLCNYLYWKHTVKDLNEQLQLVRSKQHGTADRI